MSILSYLFIPNNIIKCIVEKCKSLLPGSGNRQEARTTDFKNNSGNYSKFRFTVLFTPKF